MLNVMKQSIGGIGELGESRDEYQGTKHAFAVPDGLRTSLRLAKSRHGSKENTNATLEYGSLSQEVRKAVDAFAKEILEKHPATKEKIAEFFLIEADGVTDEQLAYYRAYSTFAVRQLIVGAYFGPNGGFQNESEESRLRALRQKNSTLVFEDEQIFHDIAHTIVALGRNANKTSLDSLSPDYHALPLYESSRKIDDRRHLDEKLANFFDGVCGGRRLKKFLEFKSSKTEEQFVKHYLNGIKDPFGESLLRRVYRAAGDNPNGLFDLFKEIVGPFMKKHAPKVP